MTAAVDLATQRLRVAAACLLRKVGWPGGSGLALMAVALATAGPAWMSHRTDLMQNAVRDAALTAPAAPDQAQTRSEAPSSTAPGQEITKLPPFADAALLLTQIEQAATDNGLAWRAADYKLMASTASKPASLEIRCSMNGPYPKIRAMLVRLIREVPGFVIRDFNVSRSNSDASDVEAKLVLAVVLRDDVPAPSSSLQARGR